MSEVCIAAFENGLRAGRLKSNFSKRSLTSMSELRKRTQEFIKEEQNDLMKKGHDFWKMLGW